MGYHATSSGTLAFSRDQIDTLWAALNDELERLHLDFDAVGSTDPDETISDKVGSLIAAALGQEDTGDGYQVICGGDDSERIDLSVRAYGKIREPQAVLAVVAQHGGVGTIEATGEDDARWRWRLADGRLHEDTARTLYDGDVDTDSWIAQLQAPDDHALDHVAVLPSEAAAIAQIADWCRGDARAHASELLADAPTIDGLDDTAVIARWTEYLGGVRFRITQVTAVIERD